MDFGEILDKWDKLQKEQAKKQKESGKNQVSHKKANAPTPEEKALKQQSMGYDFIKERENKINPIESWLRMYGTIDKDKLAEQEESRNKYKSRSSLIEMKCEARIDLHGLKREEAWQRLESFVTECDCKGLKKILIVHGKGLHTHGTDPVLGEMVRKFIETDKRLGTSGHPDYNMGGKGATWVILKNNIFK